MKQNCPHVSGVSGDTSNTKADYQQVRALYTHTNAHTKCRTNAHTKCRTNPFQQCFTPYVGNVAASRKNFTALQKNLTASQKCFTAGHHSCLFLGKRLLASPSALVSPLVLLQVLLSSQKQPLIFRQLSARCKRCHQLLFFQFVGVLTCYYDELVRRADRRGGRLYRYQFLTYFTYCIKN